MPPFSADADLPASLRHESSGFLKVRLSHCHAALPTVVGPQLRKSAGEDLWSVFLTLNPIRKWINAIQRVEATPAPGEAKLVISHNLEDGRWRLVGRQATNVSVG
jgi:hypothetical protein